MIAWVSHVCKVFGIRKKSTEELCLKLAVSRLYFTAPDLVFKPGLLDISHTLWVVLGGGLNRSQDSLYGGGGD